jgi:hypothetical protein
MFSTVGKATVNLFPQFQASGKAEIHKDPHAIVETTKTSKKEKGKDEFFFYNILDYNKEAAARLRDTSYVPRVLPFCLFSRKLLQWASTSPNTRQCSLN